MIRDKLVRIWYCLAVRTDDEQVHQDAVFFLSRTNEWSSGEDYGRRVSTGGNIMKESRYTPQGRPHSFMTVKYSLFYTPKQRFNIF